MGEATNDDVLKSLQVETFQNSPGHQKDNFCTERYAGSYSFASLRYLWLLFHGTVKSLPQSRGSFYSKKDDCITRPRPVTLHT